MRTLVIGHRERYEQRRDQLETAAEVIDVVDLRQRRQRVDGDAGPLLRQRREGRVVFVGEVTRSEIERQRQHLRFEARARVRRGGEKFFVSRVLGGGDSSERI